MGGRGASSGAEFRQITMDNVLLINELVEIRKISDEIRVANDGVAGLQAGVTALRKKQCFCCEEFSLSFLLTHEKCGICGWIDDPYQNKHPDSSDGKNAFTLNEAREQYRKSKS